MHHTDATHAYFHLDVPNLNVYSVFPFSKHPKMIKPSNLITK